MQNYYLSLIVPEFILTYYLSLPYAFLSGLPIRKVLLGVQGRHTVGPIL